MQAQAAVAGLVLAAPYAWHWRKLTLRTKHHSQSTPLQHSSGRPMLSLSANPKHQGQTLTGLSLECSPTISSFEPELQQDACTASQHSSDRQMARQSSVFQSSSYAGDCLVASRQYNVSTNPHSHDYVSRNSSSRHAGVKETLGSAKLGEAVLDLPRPIPSVRPAKQQQQHNQQHSMRSGACRTQQDRGNNSQPAAADSAVPPEPARAHDPAVAQHIQHATARKTRPQVQSIKHCNDVLKPVDFHS